MTPKTVFSVFIFCLVGMILGEDFQEEVRDLADQDWKAIDTGGWIPQPDSPPVKRRRIRKRKRRPPILEEIKEPWEDEMSQKGTNRRRLTPIFDEISETRIYEKVRNPFTALQEAEEKQKTTIEETTTADLKTLLKQTGDLSLSELLQEKNLTLAELLKGNREAISVLSEATTVKYRRLAPSIALKKEKHIEAPEEGLNSYEVMEAQRKRLALLHKNRNQPNFEVDTEATTEKRVFKATKKLPMTSAKLQKIVKENATFVPERINLNQIFGFNNKSDEPFKMVIDLGEMTTEIGTTEKSKYVTAKEEIMEVLSDPIEREHLSRILKSRNMTLEELVQQRERGSSQLHLADIFHNKTREPEPKDEPFIGHIFNHRKAKELTTKTPEKSTTKIPYTITSFPTYKIESQKTNELPLWEQLYPQIFPNEDTIISGDNFVDDIDNTLDVGRLKSHLQEETEDDFVLFPSGVKSAILASLAIVGLSLLVFITILIIFKWTQKRKTRLNRKLDESQKRTFKTFVCETLGKRTNYYKDYVQNMSDSIWQNDGKKSYMI